MGMRWGIVSGMSICAAFLFMNCVGVAGFDQDLSIPVLLSFNVSEGENRDGDGGERPVFCSGSGCSGPRPGTTESAAYNPDPQYRGMILREPFRTSEEPQLLRRPHKLGEVASLFLRSI